MTIGWSSVPNATVETSAWTAIGVASASKPIATP